MTEAQRRAKELYEQMGELRHAYNEACKAAFPVGTEPVEKGHA